MRSTATVTVGGRDLPTIVVVVVDGGRGPVVVVIDGGWDLPTVVVVVVVVDGGRGPVAVVIDGGRDHSFLV